jgi:hypothetical protein
MIGRLGLSIAAALVLQGTGCGDDTPQGDGGVDGDSGGVIDAAAVETGLPDITPRLDRGDDPCANARAAVQKEAARINHCFFEGECTSMEGACPFGCHIPYNKQEDPSKLQQLIATYQGMTQCPQCVYDCEPPGKLECNGGTCEMISF